MYAVVEAGGRQYQLTSGRFVDVDMVAGEPEQSLVFDKVLMIVNGKDSVIGSPLVEGAKVNCRIIGHRRDRKVVVYKYRPKKGTRKRTGHRQGFTRIYIDSIQLKDKVLSEAKDTGKPAKREAKSTEEAPKAKAKTAAKETAKPAKKGESKTTKAASEKSAKTTKTTKSTTTSKTDKKK